MSPETDHGRKSHSQADDVLIDTEGRFGMSLFERQERLSWQHRPCGGILSLFVCNRRSKLFDSRLRRGWIINPPLHRWCLEMSSHLEVRHDLRTPPSDEYDGILQSDEA